MHFCNSERNNTKYSDALGKYTKNNLTSSFFLKIEIFNAKVLFIKESCILTFLLYIKMFDLLSTPSPTLARLTAPFYSFFSKYIF